MSWRDRVRLFFEHHLDMRRYVTGVLTGVTISLVVLTGTGILWLAGRVIQWAAALVPLISDRPIINEEVIPDLVLGAAIVAMLVMLLRLFYLLNRIGDRAEREGERNSEQLARTLEDWNALVQFFVKQREEESQRVFSSQGPPNFAGRTGERVPVTGVYQSVEPPHGAASLTKGEVFPTAKLNDDEAGTAWVYRGLEAS